MYVAVADGRGRQLYLHLARLRWVYLHLFHDQRLPELITNGCFQTSLLASNPFTIPVRSLPVYFSSRIKSNSARPVPALTKNELKTYDKPGGNKVITRKE